MLWGTEMTDVDRLTRKPTGRVVGLDGCAGGWFAVWADPDTEDLEHELYDDLAEVFSVHGEADRLLVDIPIGVTNDGPRVCDKAAREMLGIRGVSVFPAPCRAVVEYRQATDDAASYERANRLQREFLDSGISQQAWNITDKIATMDASLQETAESRSADVFESHPECCFATLNSGYPIAHSKSNQTGRAARFAVLDAELEGWKECYETACKKYYYSEVARDDIIDAMVLVAAGRHPLESIPETPTADDNGLVMQIVVPQHTPAWDGLLSAAEL